MNQIVTLLIAFLAIFLISGCSEKQIECIKPKAPKVNEANITQCDNASILDNAKCSLNNYIEMKKERDSLRIIIEKMMD